MKSSSWHLWCLSSLIMVLTACTLGEAPYQRDSASSYVVLGKRYYVLDHAHGFSERGIASWYGEKFHGRKTASGEIYDMYAMTAAHKSLPLPTYIRVTNLGNDKSVIVKVNDRGPFIEGRIVDLSYAAAEELGIIVAGTAEVEISAVATPSENNPVINVPLFIQAGSFRNEVNARNMMRLLQATYGSAVSINRHKTGQGLFYRVQIGPIDDIDKASTVVLNLNKSGFSEVRIVTQE